MKNSSISEQLKLSVQKLLVYKSGTEINQVSNQEDSFSINIENKETSKQALSTNIATKQKILLSISFSIKRATKGSSLNTFVSSEIVFHSSPKNKCKKLRRKRRKERT